MTIFQNEERYQHGLSGTTGVGNLTEENWPTGTALPTRTTISTAGRPPADTRGQPRLARARRQGNVTSETDPAATPPRMSSTSSTAASRAACRPRRECARLTFGYDLHGQPDSEKDANGNTTTHTYDKLNRRLLTTDSVGTRFQATYDKVGNKRTETDANGNTSTHTFDGLNRLRKTTDVLGTVMEATYDKAGNKISEKDANGIETRFDYDARNRRTTVRRENVRLSFTEYDRSGETCAS